MYSELYYIIYVIIFILIIYFSYIYYISYKNISNMSNINNIDYKKFDNKVIVITGSTTGIGESIVYDLINNSNATFFLLNRDSTNQKIFFNNLQEKIKNTKIKNKIYHIMCDLTEFDSVVNGYKKIISYFSDGIDILINNAGISNTNNDITINGYNKQIQTNFISHALLTQLFLNYMKNKDKKLEVINISSISYYIPYKMYDEKYFDKIDSSKIYQNMFTSQIYYQQSKLAILLYTNYLNNEIVKNNKNIKIFCVHPGICKTNLFDKSNLPFILKYILNNSMNNSDFASKFILNTILNDEIKEENFYGINPIYNIPEITEKNGLVNDKCSKKLYMFTEKILKNYLHIY